MVNPARQSPLSSFQDWLTATPGRTRRAAWVLILLAVVVRLWFLIASDDTMHFMTYDQLAMLDAGKRLMAGEPVGFHVSPPMFGLGQMPGLVINALSAAEVIFTRDLGSPVPLLALLLLIPSGWWLFTLVRRWAGAQTALWVLLFWIILPWLVRNSVGIWTPAYVFPIGLLWFHAVDRVLQRSRGWLWFWIGFLTALGSSVHLTMVFLGMGWLVWLLLARVKPKIWPALLGVLIGAFSWWSMLAIEFSLDGGNLAMIGQSSLYDPEALKVFSNLPAFFGGEIGRWVEGDFVTERIAAWGQVLGWGWFSVLLSAVGTLLVGWIVYRHLGRSLMAIIRHRLKVLTTNVHWTTVVVLAVILLFLVIGRRHEERYWALFMPIILWWLSVWISTRRRPLIWLSMLLVSGAILTLAAPSVLQHSRHAQSLFAPSLNEFPALVQALPEGEVAWVPLDEAYHHRVWIRHRQFRTYLMYAGHLGSESSPLSMCLALECPEGKVLTTLSHGGWQEPLWLVRRRVNEASGSGEAAGPASDTPGYQIPWETRP